MWVVVMNEANVHAPITLELHGVNCSASRSGRFTPGERDSQPGRQTDSQTDYLSVSAVRPFLSSGSFDTRA